jgi:hypothetical protein
VTGAVVVFAFCAGFFLASYRVRARHDRELAAARRRLRCSQAPDWSVAVRPAQEAHWDITRRSGEPVDGVVAVRLERKDVFLTVGVARMSDDDFEGSLAALVGAGEARAAALNAHVGLLQGPAS